MHKEFAVHILDSQGIDKAQEIAKAYGRLLTELEKLCEPNREFSIAKTKLEESCFFAKKAMVVTYPETGSGSINGSK